MNERSSRLGGPVSLNVLRLVGVTFWGFHGRPLRGHLVVNADDVAPVEKALRSLLKARVAIQQLRLVDYSAANDERPMASDNTSAFHRQIVPGTSTWSRHALSRALDVTAPKNPEVQGAKVDPLVAKAWATQASTPSA
jgi:hypothetical protein